MNGEMAFFVLFHRIRVRCRPSVAHRPYRQRSFPSANLANEIKPIVFSLEPEILGGLVRSPRLSERTIGKQRHALLEPIKLPVQHILSIYTTGRMARQTPRRISQLIVSCWIMLF